MIKYITTIVLLILLGNVSVFSSTKESDDKVIISNKEETYIYELNRNGGIQVKAQFRINYKSIKPAVASFFEYYDDYREIKSVKVQGLDRISPQYGMYKQKNIFFSDAKACYFNMPFKQNGSEAIVTYEKLYKDIHHFTFLTLAELYHVDQKTITIIVPDWLNVDVLLQNASNNIVKNSIRDEKKKITTHIIRLVNQDKIVVEEDSPGYMYSNPYVMIVPRESVIKGETTKYFKTVDDLYDWSREPLLSLNTDMAVIRAKSNELISSSNVEEEKIRTLCKWVQQNIRYLAFADGISGVKPDDAQDVLSKKYGDCKGMSNLLKSLLISAGFDARLAWISTESGTGKDLDVDNPTPFANHMICALFWNDSIRYFDPTIKSLSFREIPEHLQGQKILIENGEKYLLSEVPKSDSNSKDNLLVEYSFINNQLDGTANRTFKGGAKHNITYWLKSMSSKEKNNLIEDFLKRTEVQDSISNVQIEGLDLFLPEVDVKYSIKRKSNMNIFGNRLYLNLDDIKDYQNSKIDIPNRKTSIQSSFKDNIVRTTVFNIPDGYKLSKLPENVNITRDKYSFSISYKEDGAKIIYHKEIAFSSLTLDKEDFEQWNSDIDTLRKVYNELIVIESN